MINPIGENILVKPFESDNISAGGILIPDSMKRPSNKVKIVAVGGGTLQRPMRFKGGEIAYRVQNWGEPLIIDGELHYLLNQSAIIATE